MADYFDFIKKPVTNATANPPAVNNKSQDPNPKIQTNSNNQNLNDKTATTVNPLSSTKNQNDQKIKTDGQAVNTVNGQSVTNNLDLMTHLTQRSNRVMMAAQSKAKELKSDLVDSEHLLAGLTEDSEIYNLLVEAKIQPQLINDELNKVYKRGTVDRVVQFSPRVKKILNDALIIARKLGFEFIAPEHLLLSLFEEGEGVGARVLVKLGLNKE